METKIGRYQMLKNATEDMKMQADMKNNGTLIINFNQNLTTVNKIHNAQAFDAQILFFA